MFADGRYPPVPPPPPITTNTTIVPEGMNYSISSEANLKNVKINYFDMTGNARSITEGKTKYISPNHPRICYFKKKYSIINIFLMIFYLHYRK